MKKKKKKDHRVNTDAERLHCVQMLEDGYSISYVSRNYGTSRRLLRILWMKYKERGPESVKRGKNFKASPALKKEIVLDIEKNHITFSQASLKYGPSLGTIRCIVRKYREHGLESFDKLEKPGKPVTMKKEVKEVQGTSRKEDKLKIKLLERRVLDLEGKLEFQKKWNALVREENARKQKKQ